MRWSPTWFGGGVGLGPFNKGLASPLFTSFLLFLFFVVAQSWLPNVKFGLVDGRENLIEHFDMERAKKAVQSLQGKHFTLVF